MAEAQNKRAESKMQMPRAQTLLNIGIDKEWAQMLLKQPFVSSK